MYVCMFVCAYVLYERYIVDFAIFDSDALPFV